MTKSSTGTAGAETSSKESERRGMTTRDRDGRSTWITGGGSTTAGLVAEEEGTTMTDTIEIDLLLTNDLNESKFHFVLYPVLINFNV